jgi:limonene-1,2-epoxide hydrolase
MSTNLDRRSPAGALATLAGPDTAIFLLRTVFTIAPIAFGLDKFTHLLTDWSQYLAPWIDDLVPGNADQAMYAVGVVEVVAGLVVAWRPRFGGLLVAAWLGGIILDLVTLGDYYDVALRDFGLLVGALALSALAAGRGQDVLQRDPASS